MRKLFDNFSRILIFTVLGLGILFALAVVVGIVVVLYLAVTHGGART